MAAGTHEIETINGRRKEYKDLTRPRPGDIFAGRSDGELYPKLFIVQKNGAVIYLGDESTHLGRPYEWFTHWLYVGERQV